MPSLNDLYAASKDLNRIARRDKSQPDFQLLDVSEAEFKQRYAAESVFVGQQFKLDRAHMKNLVERVYAFEDGGWGTHFTLSSMPQALTDDSQKAARLNFHPSSSAIGYNQLLIRGSVNDIIQHGAAIASRLDALAAANPARAQVLHQKSQLVQDIHDVLTGAAIATPGKAGGKHSLFSVPSAKMDKAIQSLNLDGDIGPVIQSQELYNLLKYATDNKFADLTSPKATLESNRAAVYNTLTPDQKTRAIDQLFARIKPAEIHPDNPALDAPFLATKESLHKKFLSLNAPGAQNPLLRSHLSDDEATMMNSQVLTIRRWGGQSGPLSKESEALLDRATSDYLGGFTADQMQVAAIELANLSGMGTAYDMLQPGHANLSHLKLFCKKMVIWATRLSYKPPLGRRIVAADLSHHAWSQ